MRRAILSIIIIVGLAAPARAGDEAALEKEVGEFIAGKANPAHRWRLPGPSWFEETFGKDTAKELASDYDAETEKLADKLHELEKEAGRLEMKATVRRIDAANAKPAEKLALAAMKKPAVLYAVELRSAKIGEVWRLRYFARAGDGLRYVGRLRRFEATVKPEERTDDDALVPVIDGRIARVEDKTVLITLGTDDKVEVGYEFWVYRADKTVGRIVVEKANKDSSDARVFWLAPGQTIQPGDSVTTRRPPF